MINNAKKMVTLKIEYFKKLLQKNPIIAGIAIIVIVFFSMVYVGGNNIESHQLSANIVPFEQQDNQMIGVKESIDPRDVWTAKIEQKLAESNASWQLKLDAIAKEKQLESNSINEKLLELTALLSKQQEALQRQELEESLRRSNPVAINEVSRLNIRSKSLGAFSKEYNTKKKNTKNYVTSGSFARAVLLTGVVVGTGTNTQSNPEPVMLRLTDASIFSKNKRTEQIKEAILIGDCSGDLSSERAKCRLQTISLENFKGEIIERPIQGWIVGEDGRNGIKGDVVDKSSDMLRMAMLNGVLGGMSNFLQGQSSKGIFPISPISGQQNAMSGMSQLKGGVASGASGAFSKMADFVMDRFNSMSPQIVVASGRLVDVVFQNGFDLDGEASVEQIENSGNLRKNYNAPPVAVTKQAEAFQKTMKQVNKGMNQDQNRDVF